MSLTAKSGADAFFEDVESIRRDLDGFARRLSVMIERDNAQDMVEAETERLLKRVHVAVNGFDPVLKSLILSTWLQRALEELIGSAVLQLIEKRGKGSS